ncbi:MAG: FHA domain-containing protein [Anaerolineaceae bacterium]|nr:FHA domain-containing protein [Anaerolineaceae bacterium]
MPIVISSLVMRSGPIPGSSYILEKPEVILGRELNNDIPVPDPEISRRHARFISRSDGVFVEDLGSTNGTFVNGVRIKSPTLLHHGDLVTFAESTIFEFDQKGAEPTLTQAPYIPPVQEEPQNYESYVPVPAPTPYQPVQAPIPSAPAAQAPEVFHESKKMGWCSIILIVLLISLILIILTLVFMPASWWCTLTFNALSGCPVR